MNDLEIEQAVLDSSITLTFKVSDINKLLSIVGKYPFEEVQALIHDIQNQGQPQINDTIVKLKAEAVETK